MPSELLALLGEADDDLDEAAARHTDNKLRTALPRAALSLRLRETFRQARLSIFKCARVPGASEGVNSAALTRKR